MKIIRRIVLLIAVFSVGLCIVLLLNITAPHPTGRRQSSTMPLTTNQGGSNAIGDSAERILSKDLNLPNNNDTGQRQLICSPAKPLPNCIVTLKINENYRIPDFVSPTFFADSKNVQQLVFPSSEFDQISDDVTAALVTKRQVWVFVRVNTEVAPEFARLVDATGGGIVYYFTVPGSVDVVDYAAQRGLLASSLLVGGIGLIELRALRRRIRVIVVDVPTPKKPGNSIGRKLDHAEAFAAKKKDRLYRELHDEDI